MAKKQVSWDVQTKTALVQADGAEASPAGAKILATKFDHEDHVSDPLGPYGAGHVLYHHVQDALYHEGWHNMQAVKIKVAA